MADTFLGQDPVSYGDAAHPVRQDPWEYIIAVHWGDDNFVLVELPRLVVYPILLGEAAGLSLTHMKTVDPLGLANPFGETAGGADFFMSGNGLFGKDYPTEIVIPKDDLEGFQTTANTYKDMTVIDSIAMTSTLFIEFTGALAGGFPISGAGIQDGTIVTLLDEHTGILDKPATETQKDAPIQIMPWVFQPTSTTGLFRLYPYDHGPVDSGALSDGWLIEPLAVYNFDIFQLPGTGDAQLDAFFAAHPIFGAIPADHFVVSYFSGEFPTSSTVDYNGFPMGGDSIVGLGGQPSPFVTLWQVKFDYSVYSQPYLVNIDIAKQVVISELFRFPVSDPNGVRITRFPSGTDFFIRGDGYIEGVLFDPATGLRTAVDPLWQASLGILAIGAQDGPIDTLTPLGSFDADGRL